MVSLFTNRSNVIVGKLKNCLVILYGEVVVAVGSEHNLANNGVIKQYLGTI